MSVYINNQYRIKRNAEQQQKMQQLRGKLFDGYKDILMVSAIIGYNNDLYVPIEKAASDGVLMSFFSAKDYNIIDLIAYAHTKDQSIVMKDEKYEIFSSYANGGFPVLINKLELENIEEIDDILSEKLLKKYYSLLLTNQFINRDTLADELIKN